MNCRGEEADCSEKVLGHIRVECHWTKQCPVESPQAPIACLLFCWRLTLALSEISQPQKKYKLTECTSRTTGRGTKKSLKEPNSFFSRAIEQIKTKIKKNVYRHIEEELKRIYF